MDELISIIVPVYKVESYLKKCIKSIVNQTYRNIEIILVDDGSPDDCGKICDEFSEQDSRIVVIHKENGGLSDARNAGLDIAKGNYIGFVDSDDWIACDMYEKLLNAIHKYDAEIAICCIKKIRKDKTEVQDIERNIVYSKQKALYELIVDKNVNSFAWNKLYKKELFQNLRFPKGRVFEDTLFMYQIFEKANRVVHINEPLYYYLRRDDSILGTWPLKVEIDFCIAQQDRFRVMQKLHPELIPLLTKKYFSTVENVGRALLTAKKEDVINNKKRLKGEIVTFLKENKILIKNNVVKSKYWRAIFALSYPMLYIKVFPKLKRVYKKLFIK